MGNRNWIPAPHRIVDADLGRVVYGTGDQVPLADAVKYGLIPPDQVELGPAAPDEVAPEPTNAKRGRRTRHHPAPAEDR